MARKERLVNLPGIGPVMLPERRIVTDAERMERYRRNAEIREREQAEKQAARVAAAEQARLEREKGSKV